MSLTPLDESDTEAQADGSGGSDGESPGLLERLVRRTRAFVGRVASAVRTSVDSSESAFGRQDAQFDSGPDRNDLTRKPVTRRRSESDRQSVAWSTTDGSTGSGPEEDHADGPDVVATWDNTGLTLSESGSDEAEISSDTWAEVER